MRRFLIFGILTAVLAGAAATSRLRAGPKDWTVKSALKQVDKATQGFRAATAEIRWDELFDDETISGEGRFWVSLDGRARADVAGDNPRTILAVPPFLYVYRPLEKLTERYYLPSHPDLLAQYALVGFVPAGSALTKHYDVKLLREESLDGRDTLLFGLTPKAKGTAAKISTFLLWVDQQTWLPAQTALRHEGGLQVTLRVLDLERADAIAEEVFATSWPDGTPVVDKK